MRPVDVMILGAILYNICHTEEIRDGKEAHVGFARLVACSACLGGLVWWIAVGWY